jgi:hypothetical protein
MKFFINFNLLFDVMPSSLVVKYQYFGGTCCLCSQGIYYPEYGIRVSCFATGGLRSISSSCRQAP